MRHSLWILVLAACAGEHASMASEIDYDNTSTGLVSTNVQDAIDDVASISVTVEQRVEALEARKNVIVCRFKTASLTLPVGAVLPHPFTAAECDGTLPDASYVGGLAGIETCSASLEGIHIKNAGEPDGPGFLLRKTSSGDVAPCAGPAALTAVYHRLN